jgi:GNAT superfamily N-acetyltransferase
MYKVYDDNVAPDPKGASPYRAWARWLRNRMAQSELSVGALSGLTNIREATLRSYRAGQRRPTSHLQQALARALQLPGESLQEAEASLHKALQPVREDRSRDVSSEGASLKTMTIRYPPFADGQSFFIDRFFDRFFRLSEIQPEPGQSMGFDLTQRLEMLSSDKCQLSTNLLGTLPRMKKVKLYSTPIRVSLNAVCLRRHQLRVTELAPALAFPDARMPEVWPVVVDGEVGASHVTHTLGYALKGDLAHFVDDLDPAKLAARVREQDGVNGRIACAVTDEITALAVARELGPEALLVFPLTTARSIEASAPRCELPGHILGAAISRTNKGLREYLDDAWPAMLRCEQEATASSYSRLFFELTDYITNCLARGPVIADPDSGVADLRAMTDEERRFFIYRLAKAHARRVLQLDRQSIDLCTRDSSPWTQILWRAREKTYVRVAQDRLNVRKRVVAVLQEALGSVHPAVDRSVHEKSSGRQRRPLKRPEVQTALPWLQEEFDLALTEDDLQPAPLLGGGGQGQEPDITVETLTSSIQRTMERGSAMAVRATVQEAEKSHKETVQQLRQELRRDLAEDPKAEDASMQPCISLLALYRGRYVGLVDICLGAEGEPHLRNIYVQRAHRGHGIGQLLTRRALERASIHHDRAVLIDLARVPLHAESAKIAAFFRRNGFSAGAAEHTLEYSLEYTLKQAEPPTAGSLAEPAVTSSRSAPARHGVHKPPGQLRQG